MKKLLGILLLFNLVGCSDNGKNDDSAKIEQEIIEQTIYKLTPNLREVQLIVPAEGGESSDLLESRENAFWPEHEKMKQNNKLNVILSTELTVPASGERYTCSSGLSDEFVNFLYSNELKSKKVDCSIIKEINGIHVLNKKIDYKEHDNINKPGCFGYIEYSRMYISNNSSFASFIYKYRLNNGENLSYLIKVKKLKDKWIIDKKEDLNVYYLAPSTSIQPTNIIDTIQVPDHKEKDFIIDISVNNVSLDRYPKNKEIMFKFKNNAFKKEFLEFTDLYLAVNGFGDNDKNLHFNKKNDSLYSLIIDSDFSDPFLECGICLTPKRGYVLNKMHQTGSMMYITISERLRIDVNYIDVEEKKEKTVVNSK